MSGTDSTVATAKQGVDLALSALTNAQKSYKNNEDDISSAEGDVNGAERVKDSNEDAISDLQDQIAADKLLGKDTTELEKQLATLQTNSTSLSSGVSANEKAVDTLKNSRDTLQAAIDTATTTYNNAVATYQLAVQTSLTATDTLYDAYLNAQTAYNNAVASYNASALTVDQTLATYKQTYEKDKALNNNTVSQLQLQSLYDQLDDCTIKAPMTGTVTTVKLKAGEMTVLGSTVATVTSFDMMKIAIKINEYDLFGAEEGKDVTINVDALEKSYAGTIKKIAKVATVEKGVSYFESEVDFIADEYVRSGMSVEIKLKIKEAKDADAVTNSAIQYQADNTAYVMVKNGKKTENKTVIVGVTDGLYTEITSGLSEGDVVMVAPTVAITSEDGVVE